MSELPQELQEWSLEHEPEGKTDESGRPWYFWESSGILFIRDDIMRYLLSDKKDIVANRVMVISEHTSKRVRLPVMQFTWRDIEFTLRFNYHEWKISVRSPEPLEIDWHGLLPTTDYLMSACYFEGFPPELVYDSYYANDYVLTSQFSTMLIKRYEVWTFFWMIKSYVEGR